MVCASGDAEAHRQLYVAAPRKVRRGWIKVHRERRCALDPTHRSATHELHPSQRPQRHVA